jgi:cyclophilin family peptidyl-prolyl cis-trans isomerase
LLLEQFPGYSTGEPEKAATLIEFFTNSLDRRNLYRSRSPATLSSPRLDPGYPPSDHNIGSGFSAFESEALMKAASWVLVALAVVAGFSPSDCQAQVVKQLKKTIINSDFSKGDFAGLGWQVKGAWDVFRYPRQTANHPGPVARFPAHKQNGSLTKAFPEMKNPLKLTLSLDYGWGWGDANQGADAISFMLLDPAGNGYVFEVHRCKAKWAVQWGRVANEKLPKDRTWAPEEIDATHASVRDGGGLSRLTLTRDVDGVWSISSTDWNKGAGAAVRFLDTTTTSFSRLVLLGTDNFDEQVFNRIVLEQEQVGASVYPAARRVGDFLGSLGVVTTFPDRGQPLPKTIEMIKYAGFRWVRGGIEGLSSRGPTTLQTYLDLHRQTGVRFSWGLVSGGSDLPKLLDTGRELARADALLAFEGNNEPNNWGVTYQGEKGGGRAPSWLAVAKLQRDLYRTVKGDPLLARFPVWSISEGGAETDNVGLQFLAIPPGAGALMPEGTRFADCANVHNYFYHPGSSGLMDNRTWNAADPTSICKVDGLYGNYGVTWAKHFRGHPEDQLITLPRVTTETGCTIGGPITEHIQALNLLTMYLDQFKRGWSHTAVYLLRDRTDEGGNQTFGFFKSDYTPRQAAVYLHNLTTILADEGFLAWPTQLQCYIAEQPPTVHDLLLQKTDGTFELIVWNERVKGSDEVTVHLGHLVPEVRIYDPTVGTEAIRTLGQTETLKLTLSDHPLILELVFRPKIPVRQPASKQVRVLIQTEKGSIEVELDAARAPGTVANFLRYVDGHFYDGGRFHRTVTFDNQRQDKVKIQVIQAGINPGRAKEEFPPIKLERTRDTDLRHKDGTISMARDGPDTATSDFFICIGDQPELDFAGRRNPDGQGFAAFGRVIRGMDVVRRIHHAAADGQNLAPAIRIVEISRSKHP